MCAPASSSTANSRAEQAELLRQAIENHRYSQQLLRDWETETEQLIDAEIPRIR